MKKSAILIVIIFTFIHTKAQISSDTFYVKHSKWMFGFNLGAMSAYRQLVSDGSLPGDIAKQLRTGTEKPKAAISLGFGIDFSLSGRIRISTGFFYTDPGEQDDWTTILYGLNPPKQTDPARIKLIYSYKYVGIPVSAAYCFVRKKWKIYAEAGLSTEMYLHTTERMIKELVNGSRKASKHNYTKGPFGESFTPLSFAYNLGIGLERDISKRKIVLRLQPFYKAYLTKVIQDKVALNERLQNLGLNVGVFYRIHSRKGIGI